MNSTLSQDVFGAQQQRLENYFHLFSITFLYWDHLITFPEEFKYLWKRPVRASTALFLFNRYFAVLGNVVVTVSLFSSDLTESSCQPLHLFRKLLLALNQVIVCILLTIRIYALYSCSKRVLTYMSVTGLTLVGLAIFSIFGKSGQPMPTLNGCQTPTPLIVSIQAAAAWEALFLYDLLLFIMTLHKAYKARHELQLEGLSLVAIILRDGSIYFGVMAFANLINISTYYYPDPFLRGALCTFASGMSVTMLSRLMLNLHRIADSGIFTSHITTCQLGTDSVFLAPSPGGNVLSATTAMYGTLYNEA
ncbi:hypothetical protein BT96DRAFT_1015011 [Gymnopus androsaceus JB14]|uniref:DUF6533 domain-containing protein n=1 Tax=Gymnopus androsaceus JB14 TaxID=1447944 RepID=A0A6A4IAA8_9AGAR|nr:hypothetical protein BT96DRAFT_1015011 [Gymnopus androsaceus JB14]